MIHYQKRFILLLVLILLSSCGKQSSSQNTKGNETYKIPANSITVSHFDHLDNQQGSAHDVYIRFNHDVLTHLKSDEVLHIVPDVSLAGNRVIFEPSEVVLTVEEAYQKEPLIHMVATGAVAGGKSIILFSVNTVKQDDKLEVMVSHRDIDFITDTSIHTKGQTNQIIKLRGTTDADVDSFMVDISAQPQLSLHTTSCVFNYIGEPCEISYDISNEYKDEDLVFHATIKQEDSVISKDSSKLITCPSDKESITLSVAKGAQDFISWTTNSTLVLTRCSTPDKIAQDLPVDISFDYPTSLFKSRILKLLKKDITDIIGFEPKPFFIPKTQNQATVEIGKISTASQEDMQDYLGYKINVIAQAGELQSTIQLTNNSFREPSISFEGNLSIQQAEQKNFNFTRKMSAEDLVFKLYKSGQTEPEPKENVELSALNNTLTISAKDTLKEGKYLLKAFTTKNKEVLIENSDVTVIARTFTDFSIDPATKHVLKDVPSFFFIGINNGVKSVDSSDGKLYLSLRNNVDDGCTGISLFPVDQDYKISDTPCKLSTDTEFAKDNPCACALAEGKLARTCLFKIQMPSNYGTDPAVNKSCLVRLKTDKQENSNFADILAVNGLRAIEINADNGGGDKNAFNDASRMEMWSVHDQADKLLNSWHMAINKDNFDCANKHLNHQQCLLDDEVLTETAKNFFDAGSPGQNKFIIKNYPGRNIEHTKVQIPQLNFVIAYILNTDWITSNRCQVKTALPNFGCQVADGGGGLDAFKGPVYVPAGSISVDQDRVYIDKTQFVMPDMWKTGILKMKDSNPHIEFQGGNRIQFHLRSGQ